MKRMLFLALIIFFPILVFAQSQSGDQELSASYGNKLAGFAEIGLGYKGLINAGVSYPFCSKQANITKNTAD